MNKTLSSVGVIVGVVALIVGFVAYNKTPDRIVGATGQQGERGLQGPKGDTGERGPMGPQGPVGPAGKSAVSLGSVTGPDSYFPYTANNNVQIYSVRSNTFTQATTTPCALLSPSATSTLKFGTVIFTGNSTTTGATIVTIAKALTFNATTTSLGQVTIQPGRQGEAVASTTGAQIFPPNTWFTVGIQGGTSPGGVTQPVYSVSGICQAEFLKL